MTLSAPCKPKALRPGDLVGVCAPSGAVDPERLARGVAALEALGLRVRVPDGLAGARDLFMAGSVQRRLDELYALFGDPDVAAIACARGGAGVLQLLPRLDPERLLARSAIFVGYSDLTPLHALLNAHGRVSFHGPMVARDFADGLADLDSFRATVMGEGPPLSLAGEPLVALRAGSGEGPLAGGCLSLLASLVGTPWALRPPDGAVLFLEDWDEPPYRLERLLWQVRVAGLFEGARGVVFGEMQGCATGPDVPYRLEDVLRRALEGLDVPVALGLSSGHTTRPNLTLPLGARARLECASDSARFEVLEAAVA
jgi:muramoyltetrapeptide carboxypeptidase